MDSSKFHLWRACISFCHVDKVLAEKERDWIESKSEMLAFTPEQKSQILADLVNPPSLLGLLPQITKPSDRAFLVDQIRVLAHLDGTLDLEEKKKIEEIKAIVLSKIDLVSLENQIAEEEKASYHEDEVYKVHNKASYLESLHKKILRVINPGDYKFPG
jgi:uncharacterized membrane protein YebE (DUF533 family)